MSDRNWRAKAMSERDAALARVREMEAILPTPDTVRLELSQRIAAALEVENAELKQRRERTEEVLSEQMGRTLNAIKTAQLLSQKEWLGGEHSNGYERQDLASLYRQITYYQDKLDDAREAENAELRKELEPLRRLRVAFEKWDKAGPISKREFPLDEEIRAALEEGK